MRMIPIILAVAVAALLATSPALAKGPPDKLIISGPGIAAPVEITDAAALRDLGLGGLEELAAPLEPPPQISGGYQLDRFFRHGSGYQIFDRAVYYPPAAGGRGVVFYPGLSAVGGGWSEYDGGWFQATAAGDAAMRQLLARPELQPALPATSRAPSPVPGPGATLAALLLLGAGAVVLAAWLRARPAAGQRGGADPTHRG